MIDKKANWGVKTSYEHAEALRFAIKTKKNTEKWKATVKDRSFAVSCAAVDRKEALKKFKEKFEANKYKQSLRELKEIDLI